VFYFKVIVLKSAGKYSCDIWHFDDLAGNGVGVSVICQLWKWWIIHFIWQA